jgi:hypothetical protein
MKKSMRFFRLLSLMLALSALAPTGCGPAFRKIGSSLVDGVNSQGRIDSLTNQAARGVIDGLTNGASRQKMDSLISALGHQLRLSTDSVVMDLKDSVVVLRDSLLGKYLEEHASALADTITGSKLRRNLSLLVDTLLGKNTSRKVDRLIASAINTALSDSNRYKLNHLLDSLGSTLSVKVGVLVDTAVAHIVTGERLLGSETKTELSTLQRDAVPLLIGAGVIILAATGLVIYFFWRKEKFAKLSGVLTYQIHKTRSDAVFNDLKQRVSDNAKAEGVEPLLRDLLQKKGMLGVDTRNSVPGRTA